MSKKPRYRHGVVAVIINHKNQILICERNDLKNAWQFPQGGIDKGESAKKALFRELKEELGNNQIEILKVGKKKTKYLFPKKVKKSDGAKQTWFLCRYLPKEKPDLSKSDCFQSVKWVAVSKALGLMVPWKRDAFAQGLEQLGL